MLLGETEVDYENLTVFFAEHEVRSLHISVDETSLVDFAHRHDHFHQDLNGNLEVVSLLETASGLGQVDAEEVHDDEVLLSVLNILVRIGNVLESYLIMKNSLKSVVTKERASISEMSIIDRICLPLR